MRVVAIDHVQLAMPVGAEERAREFYSGILGIPEMPRPPELARRGGAWFESGSGAIIIKSISARQRPRRPDTKAE